MKKVLSAILSICMFVGMLTIAPIEAKAASIPSNANLLNTYGNVFNYVGTACVANEILNPSILNEACKEYNSMTVGNEMKPDYVLGWASNTISVAEARNRGYYIPANYRESTVPVLDYTTVDKILKACYDKGLKMRGHTLVWHSQTPDWFFRAGYSKTTNYVDQNTMMAREEYFIKNYLGHCCTSPYASVFYAWDVVNEYVHAPSNASGYQKIFGNLNGGKAQYIKNAFIYAYDTLVTYNMTDQIHLFYNDFNTYMDVNKIVTLVDYINAEKKICAGVGMQSHLSTDFPSVAYYKSALSTFCNKGYEVQITELDVGAPNETIQAQYYYDLFKAIIDCKKKGGNITAIVWWGMSDDTSWRSKDHPLLYRTRGGQKKPSYDAVLQAYFDSGYTKVGYSGTPSNPQPSNPQPSNPQPSNPVVTTTVSDGWYYIKSVSSQKYLTVNGNNAGANVELRTGDGSANQKWKVTGTGDGYFTLTSGVGNFMMDVAYGKDEDGANIGIYNAYSGDAQRYVAQKTNTDGIFTIGTKASNGTKVLDVYEKRTADGTNIVQWTRNAGTNQQFIFEAVQNQSTQPSNPQPSNPQPSDPQPSDPQPSDPQPSNPGTASGLAVTTSVNSWGSGGQVSFKISNTGAAVSTWTLKVKKSDLKISSSWNVEIKESGDYYVITPVSWNASIPNGGSVEFGCLVDGSVNSNISCSIQ